VVLALLSISNPRLSDLRFWQWRVAEKYGLVKLFLLLLDLLHDWGRFMHGSLLGCLVRDQIVSLEDIVECALKTISYEIERALVVGLVEILLQVLRDVVVLHAF